MLDERESPSAPTSGSAPTERRRFAPLNRGYDRVFRAGELSVGLVVPIEAYPRGPRPTMRDHVARVQHAEAAGFTAVWLRDVPFDVPSFGDAGQLFDPFVYLGLLAGQTRDIALGVASAVLPLRHPAHVAKAAASADVLSGGRVILGVASGDRPVEYPAMSLSFDDRGARFRESYAYIRNVAAERPIFDNAYGHVGGSIDLVPKPTGPRLPMLITGGSQQSPQWLAENGDGWMLYPRAVETQRQIIGDWRARSAAVGAGERPTMQPLYVDLLDDPDAPETPIHLGLRVGTTGLRRHLEALRDAGVNHVALNLRFNQAPIPETLDRLARELLPALHTHTNT